MHESCRRYYVRGWFWVDIISCIPLECILLAANHVQWYNFGKFIRCACLPAEHAATSLVMLMMRAWHVLYFFM